MPKVVLVPNQIGYSPSTFWGWVLMGTRFFAIHITHNLGLHPVPTYIGSTNTSIIIFFLLNPPRTSTLFSSLYNLFLSILSKRKHTPVLDKDFGNIFFLATNLCIKLFLEEQAEINGIQVLVTNYCFNLPKYLLMIRSTFYWVLSQSRTLYKYGYVETSQIGVQKIMDNMVSLKFYYTQNLA